MPRISTMLPNSVTDGEKSSSSAIVAALMNFIVIIGVRKTAIPADSAMESNFGARWKPREATMHGIFCEQSARNRACCWRADKFFR